MLLDLVVVFQCTFMQGMFLAPRALNRVLVLYARYDILQMLDDSYQGLLELMSGAGCGDLAAGFQQVIAHPRTKVTLHAISP